MGNNGAVSTRPRSRRDVVSPPQTTNLADLLERVLDKGIVIAGDITLFLGGVQLLTLRIRLLVASIDKAQEIGINWWQFDPALSVRASARAKELEQAEKDRNLLQERLDRLERLLPALPEGRTVAEGGLPGVLQEANQKRSQAGQRSNAAAAYVLDPEGRMIAELKQLAHRPLQQLHEDVRPQALERAAQPGAVQTPAPARVLDEESRMSATPKDGRATWHLAVADLAGEGGVI